jgi:uncharacterized cupredoxin-like copper-binding protein
VLCFTSPWRRRLEGQPGTYEMYCPVDGHEQMGMKGKVVVK